LHLQACHAGHLDVRDDACDLERASETIGFFRSGPGTGAWQLTVGYDYPLSKRTGLYAYYSRINNHGNAIYDFAINPAGVKAGADLQVFALGMRHNF